MWFTYLRWHPPLLIIFGLAENPAIKWRVLPTHTALWGCKIWFRSISMGESMNGMPPASKPLINPQLTTNKWPLSTTGNPYDVIFCRPAEHFWRLNRRTLNSCIGWLMLIISSSFRWRHQPMGGATLRADTEVSVQDSGSWAQGELTLPCEQTREGKPAASGPWCWDALGPWGHQSWVIVNFEEVSGMIVTTDVQ